MFCKTISDKILKDRAFKIARDCNYGGYQRALASMVYEFFDKKTGSGAIAIRRMGVSVNEQLEFSLRDLKKTFGQQIYLK